MSGGIKAGPGWVDRPVWKQTRKREKAGKTDKGGKGADSKEGKEKGGKGDSAAPGPVGQEEGDYCSHEYSGGYSQDYWSKEQGQSADDKEGFE